MYGKSQDADPAAGAWGGIWGYRLMTRRAHGSRQSVIDEVAEDGIDVVKLAVD